MDSLNDKLTEEEKVLFILKELYENSIRKEEKEKWQKLLVKCNDILNKKQDKKLQ